jgi:hypothetical protein
MMGVERAGKKIRGVEFAVECLDLGTDPRSRRWRKDYSFYI